MARKAGSFSVLLVKNDLEDFHFLRKSLEESIHFPSVIDLAATLEEAFHKIKKNSYHLVLIESQLEDENPAFLENIRQQKLGIPFVLLLPVKDDKLLREALRCGVADVIVKSEHHFQELAERLRASLAKSEKGIHPPAGEFSRPATEFNPSLIRDELTGLYTHGYLYERVVREFSRATRHNYPISCVMLDIDSFRTINEQHGHYAGEKLLKELADLLFENCRMSDFVARYSGEEFCMVLPHSGYQGARELGTRLKNIFENRVFLKDAHQIKITVSIGISSYPDDAMSQRGDLIYFASEALAHSKSLGRNRVSLFKEVIPEAIEDLPALKISEEKIEEFQRRMTELHHTFRRSYLEATRALITALESKDKHTAGHSASVAKYSYWMAQALGLNREESEAVREGALLHDIGKVCILDNILLKPARFTLMEYEAMKQHPYLGYKIIKPIKFLQDEALLVLHHHEWFNGEGYPCKLKGEEIPLGARIICVADSYDTMRLAGGRYKKIFSVEDTVKELLACSGTQFDPAVVKAFIRVLIERGEFRPRTPDLSL